jgi:Rv2525c-like, glycoside hydrolase-like domain/Putative peptidoglycan binding domain
LVLLVGLLGLWWLDSPDLEILMRALPRRTPSSRTLLAVGLVALLAIAAVTVPRGADRDRDALELAASNNPATPRNFTGYGFDQCETVSQKTMDAWLKNSPFLAVGVYISGNSRACRTQTNLTPTWVATQLRAGWRILPITLGPQASCATRFPRYGPSIDPVISANSTDSYAKARAQGRAEADSAVLAAQKLGIVAGSTLWYDLEGFDMSITSCRESALRFTHAWTSRLHVRGYQSGFYSSASSGIKMLDKARINRPGAFTLPDYLWIARWDGKANTSACAGEPECWLSEEGWQPHRRVKQYQGGHDETWGGVKVNIDRNYLDVGRGSIAAPETHCDGIKVDYSAYKTLVPGTTEKAQVQALQCLLKEQGFWDGGLRGWYGKRLVPAVKAWQEAHGFTPTTTWSRMHWVSLHAQGGTPVLKIGSAGSAVRRLQRALNANGARIAVHGVFSTGTDAALRVWQKKVEIPVTGVAAPNTWWRLRLGR